MYKTLNPDDSSVNPFKVYKEFTFTSADSASGVFGLEGLSGSAWNFLTSSAASQSFGTYNSLSASYGLNHLAYSIGTFYKLPVYFGIKKLYYKDFNKPPYTLGGNQTSKEQRNLYGRVNVITVPQKFYGENIKPGSIKLTDDSTNVTYDIRDDGDGNLYDFAYSSSFASYKSESFADTSSLVVDTESGSVIGNAFYSQGIITITDTGSYATVGLNSGSNGFSINFKSTHTIYEYEYVCMVDAGEFNGTTNISVSNDRSGSITIKPGSFDVHKFFPPGDNPKLYGTGSYSSSYNATSTYINEVTHSDFAPYITTVGLFNDQNQLLVIGKLAKPMRNDPELKLGVVVRFDV